MIDRPLLDVGGTAGTSSSAHTHTPLTGRSRPACGLCRSTGLAPGYLSEPVWKREWGTFPKQRWLPPGKAQGQERACEINKSNEDKRAARRGWSEPARPSAHLCNHVSLVAELILPHEVGLLKLHFPEDGHVRVDADPEQRRVGTAEGAGEAGETKGRRGDEAMGASPYSMADRSMSTSSPFIRGIFFFLFLGNETSRRSICETVTSPSQEDEEKGAQTWPYRRLLE